MKLYPLEETPVINGSVVVLQPASTGAGKDEPVVPLTALQPAGAEAAKDEPVVPLTALQPASIEPTIIGGPANPGDDSVVPTMYVGHFEYQYLPEQGGWVRSARQPTIIATGDNSAGSFMHVGNFEYQYLPEQGGWVQSARQPATIEPTIIGGPATSRLEQYDVGGPATSRLEQYDVGGPATSRLAQYDVGGPANAGDGFLGSGFPPLESDRPDLSFEGAKSVTGSGFAPLVPLVSARHDPANAGDDGVASSAQDLETDNGASHNDGTSNEATISVVGLDAGVIWAYQYGASDLIPGDAGDEAIPAVDAIDLFVAEVLVGVGDDSYDPVPAQPAEDLIVGEVEHDDLDEESVSIVNLEPASISWTDLESAIIDAGPVL